MANRLFEELKQGNGLDFKERIVYRLNQLAEDKFREFKKSIAARYYSEEIEEATDDQEEDLNVEQLEVLKQEKEPKKKIEESKKFKVGDKVKVTGSERGSKGYIGHVIDTRTKGSALVKHTHNNRGEPFTKEGMYSHGELEHHKEDLNEAKSIKIGHLTKHPGAEIHVVKNRGPFGASHDVMMKHKDGGSKPVALYRGVKDYKGSHDDHKNIAKHLETRDSDRFKKAGGVTWDHDTKKEDLDEEQLNESAAKRRANVQKQGRLKIVRVRIRQGKIQRRKKVSAVKGYTLRGGKLKRITPGEKRRRKLGARRGKFKRKAKLSRIRTKMRRSLRRRASLGLQ